MFKPKKMNEKEIRKLNKLVISTTVEKLKNTANKNIQDVYDQDENDFKKDIDDLIKDVND